MKVALADDRPNKRHLKVAVEDAREFKQAFRQEARVFEELSVRLASSAFKHCLGSGSVFALAKRAKG